MLRAAQILARESSDRMLKFTKRVTGDHEDGPFMRISQDLMEERLEKNAGLSGPCRLSDHSSALLLDREERGSVMRSVRSPQVTFKAQSRLLSQLTGRCVFRMP